MNALSDCGSLCLMDNVLVHITFIAKDLSGQVHRDTSKAVTSVARCPDTHVHVPCQEAVKCGGGWRTRTSLSAAYTKGHCSWLVR